MKKKILFIDRDGTLIKEPKKTLQIDTLENLYLEKDVIISLINLQKNNFELVMVTNQDGLGTKSFPKEKFDIPHNLLINIFISQNINFNEILICPHFPGDLCKCRKPNTDLVKHWINNNILDKNNSYVIGDRISDLNLAKNMKIQGLLYNSKTFNWNMICAKLTKLNRYSKILRKTQETNIEIEVWLDSKGYSNINTGIKFFDHMLEQISVHGNILMNIKSIGDLDVDDHHTIEDTAYVLGKAIKQALGKKIGINRFSFILPMDECLASCVLDLSGRPYLEYNANFNCQKISNFSIEMIEHFFNTMSYTLGCSIHINAYGNNNHHKIESLFKVFGKTLGKACKITNNKLPTSKGIIE